MNDTENTHIRTYVKVEKKLGIMYISICNVRISKGFIILLITVWNMMFLGMRVLSVYAYEYIQHMYALCYLFACVNPREHINMNYEINLGVAPHFT